MKLTAGVDFSLYIYRYPYIRKMSIAAVNFIVISK